MRARLKQTVLLSVITCWEECMTMRNRRYGGERERTEPLLQVGEMDWTQGKGKSAEVTLAGCGQKDTLPRQYCCPDLEEDMLFLGLTASELPSNLKSCGREGFLFPALVHHKNGNL